jgi:large subunit ribosomal protein L30
MASAQQAATGQLRITLVKSTIGRPEDQKNSVKSLGLRKLNQSVVRNDDPTIRGICNKISHLVSVEEVAGE